MGDSVIAVVGLTTQLSETDLIAHLEEKGERAGVSRRCAPRGLPEAIRQARTAVSVAETHDKGTVLHFDALGILRLFVALAPGGELARFVDDELGAVLDHDLDTANPLLPTLRAYLDCDANKSRAAEQLFVQRRTLYYRLERVSTLLNRSLDDVEVRQELSLAIRALDFLRSRTAQPAT
jgi:purine catabolism regulator